MKYIAVFCLILFLNVQSILAQFQGVNITFKEKSYDFGKIKEDGGLVSHSFEISNLGTEPLIIQNVTASCGCTTPEWPKEPVMPGASSKVTATYNPMNRPGQFNKTITVSTNTTDGNIQLVIKGEVIPREKSLEEIYPVKIGNIRLKNNSLAFNRLKNTEEGFQRIEFVNTGQEAVSITFGDVPSHLTLKAPAEAIKPKDKGSIDIRFDPKKKNDWDFVSDNFYLKINGKAFSQDMINVSANIVEDFSKLSKKEQEEAPSAKFLEINYDYGTVKEGTKIEHEFQIKNDGKDDLIIRKISASCQNVATSIKDKVIGGGKTGILKIVYDTKSEYNRGTRTITVITNDPKNQRQVIWLKGIIEKQ